MAYENIKFTEQNMVIIDGCFFMFDNLYDRVLQKTDDGDTVFGYPLDTVLGSKNVLSLEYDGVCFWTLQIASGDNGLVVKKWKIDDSSTICELKDEFIYTDTTYQTYESNALGVESYDTMFACVVSGGDNYLCLNSYYNSNTVDSGTVFYLGPNDVGYSEEVVASGTVVSGSNVVYLTNGVQYDYDIDDEIRFTNSFFIFNNYEYNEALKGVLFRFNSNDGVYMSSAVAIEYHDVEASTFCRLRNVIPGNSDINILIHTKTTNATLLDVSDLIALGDAVDMSDDFTRRGGYPPDSSKWEV